jgi:hypothetical protein
VLRCIKTALGFNATFWRRFASMFNQMLSTVNHARGLYKPQGFLKLLSIEWTDGDEMSIDI